jgi:hypothetical protein
MPTNQIRGSTQIIDASIPLSKLVQQADIVLRDGSVALTGDLNVGGNQLSNVGDGVVDGDAITLGQAKALLYGKLYRRTARAAATGNVNISNPGTASFDGVAFSNGELLFLPFQSTASQNGLYVFNGSGSALTRALDVDENNEVQPGLEVFVSEGATYADHVFKLTTNAPITVGTTSLTFVDEGTAVNYTAGDGLDLTGAEFSIDRRTGSGLIITSTELDTDPAVLQYVAKIIENEIPGGSINGSNNSFTLANAPVAGTLKLYHNGLRLLPTTHFTLSGSTITTTFAPTTGDNLICDYRMA